MEKLTHAATRLGISPSRARQLASAGRWAGAELMSVGSRELWFVPEGSEPNRETVEKLSGEQREEITRRKLAGESGYALAREFGVDQSYPYQLAERARKKLKTLYSNP